MLLYGKNPILERIRANPQSLQEIYVRAGAKLPELLKAAQDQGLRISELPVREFEKLEAGVHSQGVLAQVASFKYADYEALLNADPKLCLVFLDRITDPQNLGAILRTTACFGGFAVVLPKHDSVEVTEAVLRVANGGENYVPVALVTNLVQSVELAKKAGYWIGGAATAGGQSLDQTGILSPAAIVFGSEGRGIRPGLEKHLDYCFSIPMAGAGLSLNVAVAAAIVCYEVCRQLGRRDGSHGT